LKDLDVPRLHAYPRYTVVAEKLEALSKLGMTNSRMKDYFDLLILAHHTDFDGETLCQAIKATFSRRKSNLPAEPPLGLTMVLHRIPKNRFSGRPSFARMHSMHCR
jgi:hypothetical protein